jgi:PrtD family type I secretion system ABC transporter
MTEISLSTARSRGLLAAVAIFSVFSNLLMLTGPLFMLQVYDRVLSSRSEETLVALLALVTALYALYWLIEFARARVMGRIAARFHSALAPRVFRASLDAAARGRPAPGALQDLDAIRTALGSGVVLALFDLPWTALFLAAIFLFHPLLGWVAVIGGGILVVVALLNQATTARTNREAQRLGLRAAELSRQAQEASDYVGVQGMGPDLTARWAAEQDTALDRATAAGDTGGLFGSFTRAFRFFLQSAILAAGAWLVLQGSITGGAMIAASILLGRALAPIETAISQWPVIQRARTARAALAALLAEQPAPATPTPLPAPDARLDVRGVTVAGRPGDPPVLHNITVSLAPGEALGIIGRSGSGKSTLARVLTGLVRPHAGEVRLGGATLAQYGPDGLGRHVGYLPQEVRFLDGTVAENIARMSLSPDPERVVAAAKKAHVHDIVLKLPGRLRHPPRTRRPQPLRRPEAAPGSRPRALRRPGPPRPRRAELRARRRRVRGAECRRHRHEGRRQGRRHHDPPPHGHLRLRPPSRARFRPRRRPRPARRDHPLHAQECRRCAEGGGGRHVLTRRQMRAGVTA